MSAVSKDLPQDLVQKMVLAGAEMTNVEGEDLCLVFIENTTSCAWGLYEGWAAKCGDVDPLVQAVFLPSATIVGTTLMPSPAVVWPLIQETNSIIQHYASLHINAFGGGLPLIPGPVLAPQVPARIQHAKVAISAVAEGIQRAPAITYPTIASLGSGSYICDIQQHWRGILVRTGVFKP